MIHIIKDLNSEPEFDNDIILIPSGSYSGYSHSITVNNYDSPYICGMDNSISQSEAVYLYNPMKIPNYSLDEKLIAQESIDAADKLISHFKNSASAYIKVSAINKYADELIKLAVRLRRIEYNLLLCPLRGALKPTTYLKIMNALDKEANWLPFTGASSSKFDDTIKKYIKAIIDNNIYGNSLFTTAVIDTAIGGQGINKLSDLIIQVKEMYYPNSNWELQFFIIHPEGANIKNIESVQNKSRDNLVFIVNRFEVDNLLVEDWEPALGIKINFRGDKLEIKNGIKEGRIILRDNDSILVVDSEEMSKYVDVLIASKISDAIITHPNLKYVKDVWQDYMFK